MIPAERTDPPYDVSDAVQELTALSAQLDKPALAESMNTVADTFADTAPELRSALNGVDRLSRTVASRDEAVRTLLARADGVTGLLAERSGRLVTLLTDGNLLLEELDRRRQVIQSLLVNVTATVDQLNGLAEDNREPLRPALEELRTTLDMLDRQNESIGAVIQGFNTYAGSLGEGVGGGPWFYALIPNLPPTNLAPVVPTLLGEGR